MQFDNIENIEQKIIVKEDEKKSPAIPAPKSIAPLITIFPSVCIDNSYSTRLFLAEQTSLGVPMVYSSVKIV